MVNDQMVNIIVPVKDSIETAEMALRALKGHTVTIWNDNSTAQNTARLHALAEELHFDCIDVADLTDHPSPNYLLLLQTMRQRALDTHAPLLIVESDVVVQPDTIDRLIHEGRKAKVGMVAAVTTNEEGAINFPYAYARRYAKGAIETHKRLSFCCTLMTEPMLETVDFNNLDPTKDWFDVTISKLSRQSGFRNILCTDTPVRHYPHSSRPWKQLKYTNPLLYYWRKLTQGRDKI